MGLRTGAMWWSSGMTRNSVLAIVLAAGKGTRMSSDLPKVMHELAGAPLLAHVLSVAQTASIDRLCGVIAPGMEHVDRVARAFAPEIAMFIQPEPRGTADAVKAAQQAFASFTGPVLVLYGDTPLLRAATLHRLRSELETGADLVVIGFDAPDPTGYGRLLLDDGGRLTGIREEKDASGAERALTLCNSGIMGFRSGQGLAELLARIGDVNAKREFYLTDAVALARGEGLETRLLIADAEEVLGVNSRAELAYAERVMQERLRAE